MKALTNYITEAIKIGKSADHISVYTCQPKDKKELKDIIKERIHKESTSCDLNDIDVSKINDMSELFYRSAFNGDISRWDVSNATDMESMFECSGFNQDISNWDVSNVKNMYGMFYGSKFNQDISNWKIDENCETTHMFMYSIIQNEFKPKSLQRK